jgi:hypothetical protein
LNFLASAALVMGGLAVNIFWPIVSRRLFPPPAA